MMKYPPPTPLDVMELHGGREDFEWNNYYACDEPGLDAWGDEVLFDWRCTECVASAGRILDGDDDPEMWWIPSVGGEGRVVRLSWLYARAKYWEENDGSS